MPVPESLVPFSQYMTEIEFPELLGRMVENEPLFRDHYKVRWTADHPKQEADLPSIQYDLYRLVPGIEGVETTRARVRNYVDLDTGSLLEQRGQFLTAFFQFNCWAYSSQEAQEIVSHFDHHLETWKGHFQELGLKEAVWMERLRDYNLTSRLDNAMVYSTRWRVMLQRITSREVPSINEVYFRLFGCNPKMVVDTLTRSTTGDHEYLSRPYTHKVWVVSDPSASGTAALSPDYLQGIDYCLEVDPVDGTTRIVWMRAGKRPAAGSTYYARHTYHEPWRYYWSQQSDALRSP